MSCNFIVYDLESTCWEKKPKLNGLKTETIEIGAVKLDMNLNLIDEFDEFIRPIINPTLSDFCMNLTHITQADVNSARLFKEVITDFKKWVGEEYLLCSWGFYDKLQLMLDCETINMNTEWLQQHISVKHQYMEIKGLKKCGLGKALELEDMPFEGTQHRGIDDSRNTAKIFVKYFEYFKYPK